MSHIDRIKPEAFVTLSEHCARRTENDCYYRAHYVAPRRNGKPVRRFIELHAEVVGAELRNWVYRSGYVYSDVAKFWTVPDTHREHCEAFAAEVVTRAVQALRSEIRRLESAAIFSSVR